MPRDGGHFFCARVIGWSSTCPPTDSHADSGAGHSQADVVGQGDVDAEDSRVVEELAEDHLAVGRGRGLVTDCFHWCDAVGVRDDGAHLSWQTAGRVNSYAFLETTDNKVEDKGLSLSVTLVVSFYMDFCGHSDESGLAFSFWTHRTGQKLSAKINSRTLFFLLTCPDR